MTVDLEFCDVWFTKKILPSIEEVMSNSPVKDLSPITASAGNELTDDGHYDSDTDTVIWDNIEELVLPNENVASPTQPDRTSPSFDFIALFDKIKQTAEEYRDTWDTWVPEPEPDIKYDPVKRIQQKYFSRMGTKVKFEQVHHFERRKLYVMRCDYPGGNATGTHSNEEIAMKIAAHKALNIIATAMKQRWDSGNGDRLPDISLSNREHYHDRGRDHSQRSPIQRCTTKNLPSAKTGLDPLSRLPTNVDSTHDRTDRPTFDRLDGPIRKTIISDLNNPTVIEPLPVMQHIKVR